MERVGISSERSAWQQSNGPSTQWYLLCSISMHDLCSRPWA